MNDWAHSLIESAPYLGVFGVLLLCGLGLPLPEDVPLLLGGYLAHRELASPWVMAVIGLVGVLSGDLVLFSLGYRYGERILDHRLMRRLLNRDRLRWAEDKFVRFGKAIIFVGRFMPGARPVVFATAGVFRVRPLTFLAIDGLAALISVPVWIAVGYKFGKEAHAHLQGPTAKFVIFGTLALILLLWILWELHQSHRHRAASKPADDGATADPAAPAASLPAEAPRGLEAAARTPARRPAEPDPRSEVQKA